MPTLYYESVILLNMVPSTNPESYQKEIPVLQSVPENTPDYFGQAVGDILGFIDCDSNPFFPGEVSFVFRLMDGDKENGILIYTNEEKYAFATITVPLHVI